MIDLFTIQKIWGIQNPKIARVLSANGGRSVSLIDSTQGRFVLKGYPQRYAAKRLQSYVCAQVFLNGKSKKIAPEVIRTAENKLYADVLGEKYYLMEFIDGRQAVENADDEFIIGQAAAYLHTINDYTIDSDINTCERIESMRNRYSNRSFKIEYDEVIDTLPDFNQFKHSYIHTDIGPHNTIITPDGKVIFVDFDDAGRGSIFIDAGYPLIAQFVRYRENKRLSFDFDNAKAFYGGYFSVQDMNDDEKELIYFGAVFMQLMYMPCFGEEAVDDMWGILKYAVDNKAELMRAVCYSAMHTTR